MDMEEDNQEDDYLRKETSCSKTGGNCLICIIFATGLESMYYAGLELTTLCSESLKICERRYDPLSGTFKRDYLHIQRF